MAQKSTPKQGAPKPPRDPYAQRAKELTSAAQRLRGWVSSDASREIEFADALVALNHHRLLGHSYAAAAADAQEAARRSAQLLTANGPIGPYTAAADASRYLAAVVQLAIVQVALGIPEAAGRTLDGLPDLREQLATHRIEEQIDPVTAIWALIANARVALAGGDPAAANAYADAALDRLAESGLSEGSDADYLVIDVERLASDARWVVGRGAESLAHLHSAKDRYDRFVDGRLAQPGRLSPALLERLAEPLFGLTRDLADRLAASGETELGLVIRRSQVDLLTAIAPRLAEPTTGQLATAVSDLAADLRAAGRDDEAATLAAGGPARERTPLGPPSTWAPLDHRASYAATTANIAAAQDESALEAQRERETEAWLAAQRAEAHRLEEQRLAEARQQAEQRVAERRDAERAEAEQRAADEARRVEEERLDAERQAAAEEAEQAERKRRREERMEAYRLEAERLEAERLEAERLAADPEAAELERLQRELAELEGDEPDSGQDEGELPAHQEEPPNQPEPVEADDRPSTSSGQPVPEPAAHHEGEPPAQRAVEPEPDPLEGVREGVRRARALGDRKAIRAALDELVEMLRPRAEGDLATYGPELRSSLEELSGLRLRGGDIFGSRSASREAKSLARSLDR